jgi:hypothetical protein
MIVPSPATGMRLPFLPSSLGRLVLGFTLCFAALLLRAQSVSNGDFANWSSGRPVSWTATSDLTTTRVEAWSGPAARLGLASGAAVTASLSQGVSPAFTGLFEVAFDFAQAASGTERGANLTLRHGSDPLLTWRVGPDGALDLFDGSAWRAVAPAGSILATDPAAPALARTYRIILTGSLGHARLRLQARRLSDNALLADVADLSFWQNPPAGRAIDVLRVERGRSGGDYLVDNVALRVPATAELAVIAPSLFPDGVPVTSHPFLLFRESEIPALRALAAREPWTSIAADALLRAETLRYDTTLDYRSRALRLRDVVSALSLAALIDPEGQATLHATRFHQQLTTGLDHLLINRPQNDWDGNTPVGSALFSSLLALDVLRPHLTPAQLNDIHSRLATWVPSVNGWEPSPQSLRALWALYQGDLSTYAAQRDAFLTRLFDRITVDGVHVAGPGYALARLNFYDREQKHLLLDVIRRHGGLAEQHETRIRRAYEWLYGYALGAHGRMHIFGDTAPNRGLSGAPSYPINSPTAAYRAGRFSPDAQAYANHRLLSPTPAGGLLSYVLVDSRLRSTPAAFAPSRVFPDGGAWFQTDADPRGVLSGAMWNATLEEGHTHKETNALSLSAYNELLLVNAGYAGYGAGALGFSWTYVNDRAIAANTVLIDYPVTDARNAPATNDHARRRGAGLVASSVNGRVDYAKGDSGLALPNGRHFRHFAFVHPRDGLPGYWLVLDEVQGTTGAVRAHAAWHPYAPALQTMVDGEHYRADCQRFSTGGVSLHLHLTSAANEVRLLDGAIAHFDNESFLGRFLYPAYNLGAGGYRRFGLVLFPAPPGAATPGFTRESGPGWQATRITWSDGRVDRWVVTDTDSAVTVGGVVFRGKAAWLRSSAAGELLAHLLVEGDRLAPVGAAADWFSASAAGTLYADGERVALASPGAPAWTVARPGATVLHGTSGASFAAPGGGGAGVCLPAGQGGWFDLRQPPVPRMRLALAEGEARLGVAGLDPLRGYRWQSSADLRSWTNFGARIEGKAESAHDAPLTGERRFFRVVSEP